MATTPSRGVPIGWRSVNTLPAGNKWFGKKSHLSWSDFFEHVLEVRLQLFCLRCGVRTNTYARDTNILRLCYSFFAYLMSIKQNCQAASLDTVKKGWSTWSEKTTVKLRRGVTCECLLWLWFTGPLEKVDEDRRGMNGKFNYVSHQVKVLNRRCWSWPCERFGYIGIVPHWAVRWESLEVLDSASSSHPFC